MLLILVGSAKAPLSCGRRSPQGLCSLREGCRTCEEGVPVLGVIKWNVTYDIARWSVNVWEKDTDNVLRDSWATRDAWGQCVMSVTRWLYNNRAWEKRVRRRCTMYTDQLQHTLTHSLHRSSPPSKGCWYFDANAPVPCSCCVGAGDVPFSFVQLLVLQLEPLCRSAIPCSSWCASAMAHCSALLPYWPTARRHRSHNWPAHTERSLYRGSSTIGEFCQFVICGSDVMPFSDAPDLCSSVCLMKKQRCVQMSICARTAATTIQPPGLRTGFCRWTSRCPPEVQKQRIEHRKHATSLHCTSVWRRMLIVLMPTQFEPCPTSPEAWNLPNRGLAGFWQSKSGSCSRMWYITLCQ